MVHHLPSAPAILGGQAVKRTPWPQWPFVTEEDIRRVNDVLRSGKWNRSSYPEGSHESCVVRFEKSLEDAHRVKHAVACANGTAAIEIALKAAGLLPGQEVIVPAYTFVATATSVLQVGGLPVFADVDPDTYNLDAAGAEKLITPNTRAIVAVHMAGRPFDIDAVGELARKHNLLLIEDGAQSIGASWKGTPTGNFGDAGTFSFQNSKNIASGEGGAVVTNDETIAEMAYSLHHIGRKKGRPFYEHHYSCWNYRMTEVQAAILLGQMERLEEQTRRRNENGAYLNRLLSDIEGIHVLPDDPRVTMHGYHLYLFKIDPDAFGLNRRQFMKALAAENVPNGSGYPIPLYKNPLFQEKNFGIRGFIEGRTVDYRSMHCPNTERLVEQTVSLPQYVLLGTREDMEAIAEGIRRIKAYAKEIGNALGEEA